MGVHMHVGEAACECETISWLNSIGQTVLSYSLHPAAFAPPLPSITWGLEGRLLQHVLKASCINDRASWHKKVVVGAVVPCVLC